MVAENGSSKHVAITGASSGIGKQLALLYAREGAELSLAARRSQPLEDVAEACRHLGGRVSVSTLDVRNSSEVQHWFERAESRKPVTLLIANAGIFDGNGANNVLESAEEARQLIEINTLGAIYTVQAALPAMRQRRSGHIAVVSSLAAVLPGADAPSYGASKAALVAYCDAIRRLVAGDGVTVTSILPGHVDTPQTKVHVGPLAFIISVEDAARRIKAGLDRRRTLIAFPWTAHALVRIASWLPWRLRELATRGDRFHVRKD